MNQDILPIASKHGVKKPCFCVDLKKILLDKDVESQSTSKVFKDAQYGKLAECLRELFLLLSPFLTRYKNHEKEKTGQKRFNDEITKIKTVIEKLTREYSRLVNRQRTATNSNTSMNKDTNKCLFIPTLIDVENIMKDIDNFREKNKSEDSKYNIILFDKIWSNPGGLCIPGANSNKNKNSSHKAKSKKQKISKKQSGKQNKSKRTKMNSGCINENEGKTDGDINDNDIKNKNKVNIINQKIIDSKMINKYPATQRKKQPQ